ncbi:MAG: aminopeptidase P family protein [Deltaproteobacteria bacterium]|nr:aminopeptidase P family protein [Deltaproteobacteria bacterium]
MSPKTKSRIEKLLAGLGEKNIDGILISQPENRRYLSGFDGSAGFLIITPQKNILATDSRYTAQAKSQAPEYEIFPVTSDIENWFPGLAAGLNIKRLGFEGEYLTFSLYRRLCDILGKGKTVLKFVPVEDVVESLRAVKEPGEIELIARAAEIADAAMAHIREELHPGMTEKEAAWEIEKFMRDNGSQPLPFDVIVASGPNSALPHTQPSARAIREAEPIVIDIGARVEGYASDLSRTVCLGAPDDTFKKVYDTVLGAQLGAIAVIKPEMSGGEADQIARIIIEEGGYGEAFGHGLGHGVGLAIHEKPRLGSGSSDKLADGMVFAIEPGIYIEGWGGVRIEDLVIMEAGKIREISKARK